MHATIYLAVVLNLNFLSLLDLFGDLYLLEFIDHIENLSLYGENVL